MAYQRTEWDDGDVITAQKLNKIEEAITIHEPHVFVTTTSTGQTQDSLYLDYTYAQIVSAAEEGLVVMRSSRATDFRLGYLVGYSTTPGTIEVTFSYFLSDGFTNVLVFSGETEDGVLSATLPK